MSIRLDWIVSEVAPSAPIPPPCGALPPVIRTRLKVAVAWLDTRTLPPWPVVIVPPRSVSPVTVTPAEVPMISARIVPGGWIAVVFAPAPWIVIRVALVGTVRAPDAVVTA